MDEAVREQSAAYFAYKEVVKMGNKNIADDFIMNEIMIDEIEIIEESVLPAGAFCGLGCYGGATCGIGCHHK